MSYQGSAGYNYYRMRAIDTAEDDRGLLLAIG
jgi:hypothetical protein